MSFGILKWKVKKLFTKSFKSEPRYVIRHGIIYNRIFVYVFDNKDSTRVECRYGIYSYRVKPNWWNKDMYDASYIYIDSPTSNELEYGITFEILIEQAYSTLQVIADALNKEDSDMKERKQSAEQAAKIAKRDAKKASKKFSSKKM